MSEHSIYQDIALRTGGDIYIGVVGPVRTGKSTFINAYAGKNCAKTGNKPGVTKGKQWIRMGKGLELLDTPGILWPKFEDQQVGIRLAMIGSINENILNIEELSLLAIDFLRENYPGAINRQYEVEEEAQKPLEVLERIAERRKCLAKGGEYDYAKTAAMFMDDFRNGRIGRISLEKPAEENE